MKSECSNGVLSSCTDIIVTIEPVFADQLDKAFTKTLSDLKDCLIY